MKRRIRMLASLTACGVVAACGSDSRVDPHENLATSAAALAAGATIPEPLATPGALTSAWDGTLVDLMAMDTWATCGTIQVNGVTQPIAYQLVPPANQQQSVPPGDSYLGILETRAIQIMSNRASANPPALSTPESWIAYRNDPAYNRNSASHQPQSASLAARNLAAYALDLNDPTVNPGQWQATQSVALASMNACIAQGVRTLSLGGNMLVMSEAEQIQALELVRERAQVAMLQYAAIFNALASPGPAFTGTTAVPATPYQAMAYLQKWGAAPTLAGQAALAKWVTDFSVMVQLHLEVTEELADLFRRSAAAKSPRGGTTTSPADEAWGAGAWRQRMLALLYGGDPLAADASTPWANMAGRADPGVALDTSIRPADPWPSRGDLPYFTTDAAEPHVQQFFALAQQNNALRVLNNADGSANTQSSAEWMYRSVEAALRTQQCTTVASDACKSFTLADIPPWSASSGATPMETYTLYTTFGITSAHAVAAAKLVDDYTPAAATPAVHLLGALSTATDAAGTWRVVPRDVTQVPRSLIEVEPLFERFSPYRIPTTVDPNVGRTHYEHAPNGTVYRSGDDQGLAAGGIYAESMRTFGAVPALSLVRDVIGRVTSSTTATTWLKSPLSTMSSALLASIAGAVGSYATRVSPIEQSTMFNWAQIFPGAPSIPEKLQTIKVVRSPTVVITAGWAVDVDIAPGNDFFQNVAGVTFNVIAIPNDPTAYGLALSPTARRLDGKRIADLAATTSVMTAPATVQSNSLHAELYIPAVQLTQAAPPPTWTLVVQRVQGTAKTYAPLTGAVPVYTWQFNRAVVNGELAPILSYQFAGGGHLGRLASQVWSVERSNPSQPAYDGFGLPYTWVPVADATAFGSQAGDSVMTYFLRNAESAAQQATQAVQAAITSSLQADQASLDQQAAKARFDLVLQQQAQTLCGAATSATCNFDTPRVDLGFVPWTPIPAAWQGISTDPATYCQTQIATDTNPLRQLDCTAYDRISRATHGLPLATPVAQVASSSAPQTFDAFAGGQLQGDLVTQWAAVRRLVDAAQKVETGKLGAAARIQSAQHTLDQLDHLVSAAKMQLAGLDAQQQAVQADVARLGKAAFLQCQGVLSYLESMHLHGLSLDAFTKVMSDPDCRVSGKCLDATDPDEVVLNVEKFTASGWKADPGQWAELKGLEASCLQAQNALDQTRQEAEHDGYMAQVQAIDATASQDAVEAAKGTSIAAMMDGIEAIQSSAAEMDAAVSDLAKSVAVIANERQQAQLAVARQQLESALATQNAELSSGMARQFNQYDWWRARALLDGARRYAVAALRSIETQYVTSLDTLLSPEPFVAAPSTWANDVYKYDLSMPSAVGLSAGTAVSGAQYPNQVLDYVGNLQRFVQGFAVERPMSAAVDNDIVTLPGPGAQVVVNGQLVADPARAQWSVLCPAGASCTTPSSPGWCPTSAATSVAQTCAVPPAVAGGVTTYITPNRVRATLLLDAWGRRIADTAVAQFKARVNARWGRFAVNLVGNGIRDCSAAQDPNRCQASQYLAYDLRHAGPALAIGATQQWRLLDIPLAQVESGKAATLGEFLDVELNGWGRPYVEAIARTEFIGRPMNGSYVLELQGDASTNFDAIQAVQVLLGSSYWVMQQ